MHANIEEVEIEVKRLDLSEIAPRSCADKEGGGIYLIIGPTGSGKTKIISSLCYAKKHFIPITAAFSESESFNNIYKQYVAPLFISEKLTTDWMRALETRQIISCQKLKNPYITLILDDCMNKRRNLSEEEYIRLFKISRHQKINLLIAMQYHADISTSFKNQCAGVFLLKNDNQDARTKLYANFGGVFPSRKAFEAAMDGLTTEYTSLFINFRSQSNDWQDKIRWFRAYDNIDEIKWNACNKDVVAFSNERFDINSTELGALTLTRN